MTTFDNAVDLEAVQRGNASTIRPVTFDLYRDIHKAIRSELFAVATEIARVDPSDAIAVNALHTHVQRMISFLVDHAEHEDGVIQPVLVEQLPALADRVADEHETLERRMAGLLDLSTACVATGNRRFALHQLYLEWSAFIAGYLLHIDLEERVIGPAVEDAVGVPRVIEMHEAIVGSIPPPDMAAALALMLPAMNLDDRVEMLGGMRMGAPAEVFSSVWNLTRSVLACDDFDAVSNRLFGPR
ncbi:MAG: hemerythrin domain-containing protein [Acidimicrobiia bacterium]